MDGIITSDKEGWTEDYYKYCKPNFEVISLMRDISKKGHKIIIYTSRLSNEVKALTTYWLEKHNVPYDAIHFDKPLYDFMLDDKTTSLDELKKIVLGDK